MRFVAVSILQGQKVIAHTNPVVRRGCGRVQAHADRNGKQEQTEKQGGAGLAWHNVNGAVLGGNGHNRLCGVHGLCSFQ